MKNSSRWKSRVFQSSCKNLFEKCTGQTGSTISSRRSSAIFQVPGFYAAAPQLDLNFVLQSCKAFENEGNGREVSQTDGASVTRSLPNYYAQARARNAYAKGGSFAECFRKPFGCPKCGRCFTVKGNMTRHLKYECGQAPRFQCPYCEFRSKQTSNVMSHIRTRHTGQRVYVVHLKYENWRRDEQRARPARCINIRRSNNQGTNRYTSVYRRNRRWKIARAPVYVLDVRDNRPLFREKKKRVIPPIFHRFDLFPLSRSLPRLARSRRTGNASGSLGEAPRAFPSIRKIYTGCAPWKLRIPDERNRRKLITPQSGYLFSRYKSFFIVCTSKSKSEMLKIFSIHFFRRNVSMFLFLNEYTACISRRVLSRLYFTLLTRFEMFYKIRRRSFLEG